MLARTLAAQWQASLLAKAQGLACMAGDASCSLGAGRGLGTQAAEASTSQPAALGGYLPGAEVYIETEQSRRRKLNLQFCRERAAWKRQMTQLRKQWMAEWKAERAAAEEARRLEQQQVQVQKEQRQAQRRQTHALAQLKADLAEAELAVQLVGGRMGRDARRRGPAAPQPAAPVGPHRRTCMAGDAKQRHAWAGLQAEERLEAAQRRMQHTEELERLRAARWVRQPRPSSTGRLCPPAKAGQRLPASFAHPPPPPCWPRPWLQAGPAGAGEQHLDPAGPV
jgi:hypothetical protein